MVNIWLTGYLGRLIMINELKWQYCSAWQWCFPSNYKTDSNIGKTREDSRDNSDGGDSSNGLFTNDVIFGAWHHLWTAPNGNDTNSNNCISYRSDSYDSSDLLKYIIYIYDVFCNF